MTPMQRLVWVSRAPAGMSRVSAFLRLFLGLTFTYTGLQKLTDPGFLDLAATGYVGEQLLGFVRAGSPLSPLIMRLAVPNVTLVGAVVALAEIWIGVFTLAGLPSRPVLSHPGLTIPGWLPRPGPAKPLRLRADRREHASRRAARSHVPPSRARVADHGAHAVTGGVVALLAKSSCPYPNPTSPTESVVCLSLSE